VHMCYAIAAIIACAACGSAQELFDSPEAAVKAIVEAAGNHDSARLAVIVGSQPGRILTSGDPAQDRAEQTEFARLARARQRIEVSPLNPNRAILAIGDEDWPFPVPLHRENGKWRFDATQAPAEMRARRIGANELDAIEICHGYVDAQTTYASEAHEDGGMLEYSPRLMSEPGRQNGLYWGGSGQPLIPEGLARAEWRGSLKGEAQPYHGYYFRVLDGQGSNAPGGAHKYLAKGKMIGGFGLVAWPAEYGVTGIHSFIVNQDGVVYEKDITPLSGKLAAPITGFDPDHSWEPVD
jgi:DUF2950 family protein